MEKLFEVAEKSEILAKATLDRIEQKQTMMTKYELELANGVFNSDKIESRVLHSLQAKTDFEHISYTNLSTEGKQSLLRIIVDKILLNENGEVTVIWKE